MAGLVLIALALSMDQGWFDRHFLPSFAQSRPFQWRIVQGVRICLAAAAIPLLLLARPTARAIAAGRGKQLLATLLPLVLAVAAAVTVTELVLGSRAWHATQEQGHGKEPLHQPDAQLGWVLAPGRLGSETVEGHRVDYAIDRHGYRVAKAGMETDVARPQLVLAGESVLLGYGLAWQDSVQARLQAMLGLPVANISTNAYATDQIYMRLRRELPHFAHPVGVVLPFMSILLDRNLDHDRPWLDADLHWHPAQAPDLRLIELARRPVRYRSAAAVADGVARTQAVLRASFALVRARGAVPILVVPQYVPEEPSERAVRLRVLDAAHIPYLLVPLDARWRLARDRHPNGRGALAIAAALAQRLRETLCAPAHPSSNCRGAGSGTPS